MVIESKTLIEDTCRQFERNFAAGDLAKLVSDYYHPECLVVGEGIGRSRVGIGEPTTFVYAVSWRRENSTMKVVLDYFAPPAI